MINLKKTVALLSVSFLLLFTACSENVQSGGNDAGQGQDVENIGDNDASDGDSEQNGCEDGQSLNPITGGCTNDDPEGDGDSEDCPDGEVENPATGECEVECDGNEVVNPETGECEEPVDQECGLGAIEGQACAPSGQDLGQAMVSVHGEDCDGESFTISTQADAEGFFALYDVPSGAHQLQVTSGSFSGERAVPVASGQTTQLLGDSDKVCVEGDEVQIMVFQGFNENMGNLLDDLGIEFDTISSSGAATANLLSNLDELMEYDILFFECNHRYTTAMSNGDESEIVTNLQYFVNQGNSIYAADNAYEWALEPFPELATFGGTSGREIVDADVMSSAMLTLLGADTMEVDFDLSGMRVINEVHPPSLIHFRGVRGGVDGRPLMYSYTEPINEGTVIYTSFHSSAQGTASDEILDVLSFLIFQL